MYVEYFIFCVFLNSWVVPVYVEQRGNWDGQSLLIRAFIKMGGEGPKDGLPLAVFDSKTCDVIFNSLYPPILPSPRFSSNYIKPSEPLLSKITLIDTPTPLGSSLVTESSINPFGILVGNHELDVGQPYDRPLHPNGVDLLSCDRLGANGYVPARLSCNMGRLPHQADRWRTGHSAHSRPELRSVVDFLHILLSCQTKCGFSLVINSVRARLFISLHVAAHAFNPATGSSYSRLLD